MEGKTWPLAKYLLLTAAKSCEHLSLTLKRRYWAALPRKRKSFYCRASPTSGSWGPGHAQQVGDSLNYCSCLEQNRRMLHARIRYVYSNMTSRLPSCSLMSHTEYRIRAIISHGLVRLSIAKVSKIVILIVSSSSKCFHDYRTMISFHILFKYERS